MASAIKVAQGAPRKTKKVAGAAWAKERAELLRTHHGWYVAYRDRKRVALEPTIEQLMGTLEAKLGSPRRPCELHLIVEKPPRWRGPSPRVFRPGQPEH